MMEKWQRKKEGMLMQFMGVDGILRKAGRDENCWHYKPYVLEL